MNSLSATLGLCSALTLAGFASDASAQCVIDQNQTSATVFMAAFSQTDLAQSFQQSTNGICGAGIFLRAGIGTSDNVQISLWTNLPNAGGTLIVQASTIGTAGTWADVFWPATAITANTTFFLVFDGNTTLGIAGDTAD